MNASILAKEMCSVPSEIASPSSMQEFQKILFLRIVPYFLILFETQAKYNSFYA